MPPEWAPHEATWLSWPRRDGISFPHAYEEVIPAFAHMIDALRDSEKVNRINVMDVDHENEVRFLLKETRYFPCRIFPHPDQRTVVLGSRPNFCQTRGRACL